MGTGIAGRLALTLVSAWMLTPLCVAQTAIAGDWKATAEHDGQTNHVTLHITAGKDGSLSATIDAPERGANDTPVDSIAFKDSKLTFAVDAAPGTYEGTVSKDGSAIEGAWSEQGHNVPLNFARVALPVTVPIAGDWKGVVDHGDRQTHVVLHLTVGADGSLSATLDAIEMDASGVAVSNVLLKDAKLTFAIDAAPGTYAGMVSSDGTEIAGTWTSQGKDSTLNFKRASAADAAPAPAPAPAPPATPPPSR